MADCQSIIINQSISTGDDNNPLGLPSVRLKTHDKSGGQEEAQQHEH